MIMQRKGRGRRWRIFLLILSALILLSVSWIISARVIFGQYLIAMFVTLIYTRRLRLRESVAVVAVILLTLAYFDYAQLANKSSGVKAATGQSGLSDLTKYYTASLDNAVHLLNDRPDVGQSARGYWLLRSALNMPLLGKLNQSLYRQLGQEMPITTRQGDFDYARRLGVDPQFNTFTFFGYNYLDWGYFGGVLATTLVFCLYLLVYFFSLRNSLYAVLSMGLVSIAVLETFRTQVVYSDITIAYLIILAVLYLANRRRPGKERA